MTHPNHVILQPCTFGGPIKWYEQGPRAREVMTQFPDFTFSHLEWEAYAFPGGYEITYVTEDNGMICHGCANKELERTIDPDDEQFFIVSSFMNYEDDQIWCDHCGLQIEPAYGENHDQD